MTSQTNRTILYSLTLVGIAIILTIPDVIFDFTVDLVHTLFEFLLESMHTLFEGVELILDEVIEHTFHTDLQQTQLIVFYIMLLIGLGLSYGLLKLLIRLYRKCKNILASLWLEEKTLISLYWLKLSLINKVKLIAIIGGLAYLFFLVSF
jgi:hypothetical protein